MKQGMEDRNIKKTIIVICIIFVFTLLIPYAFSQHTFELASLDLTSEIVIAVIGLCMLLILAMRFSLKKRKEKTVKICKRCSAVPPDRLEKEATENGYRVKYGCIGKCMKHGGGEKRYVGVGNKTVIQTDTEADFFEKLRREMKAQAKDRNSEKKTR